MPTDPQSLISLAACFLCYGMEAAEAMELALLSLIAVSGVGLATPTNVTSQAVFVLSYQINWTNVAPVQTGVEVWLSIAGGAYFLANTVGPTVTTYTDGGPWGGSTVCGKVRAVNGAQVSAFSPPTCVVYP